MKTGLSLTQMATELERHAKLVRVRKAAYEASYWLESGTRRAQ